MNISERNYKNGLRSITALLWCNDMYLIWILTQHARSWTDNSIAWWIPHEPGHEHILLSHIESVYPSSIPKAPKQIEVFRDEKSHDFRSCLDFDDDFCVVFISTRDMIGLRWKYTFLRAFWRFKMLPTRIFKRVTAILSLADERPEIGGKYNILGEILSIPCYWIMLYS